MRMERIEIRELNRFEDDRGWLLKILTLKDLGQNTFGEIYITSAYPGVIKANHYHQHTNEWFCVIKGKGKLVLQDPTSRERKEVVMGMGSFLTVKIPKGIAHAVKNIGEDIMYLVAIADVPYNPQRPDTFPYDIDC